VTRILQGRVVVLSPHLDDAALSLGATIAAAVAGGAEVRAVTVFGNDPDAEGPARPWDRACGFATAAEAARGRRAEDERACAILGAAPTWLPFGDREHAAAADEDVVWRAVTDAVGQADIVLAPGWPLHHADHAWVSRNVLARPRLAPRVGLYVEQPYAVDGPLLAVTRRRPGPRSPLPGLAEPLRGLASRPRWRATRPRPVHWRAKHRAIGAYRSQLGQLGPMVRARIASYEAVFGSEAVWWQG
jgi:LmbE family N-acetylglucosaminyl deacetylase